MRKLNIILASSLAFAIIFLSCPIKAQQTTPTKKAETKTTDKKEVKKVPTKKTNDKKSKTAK